MVNYTKTLKVGIYHWRSDDELSNLIGSALTDLGCQTQDLVHPARLPDGLDVILTCGPNGSLVPLLNQIIRTPPPARPLFVFWLLEQLPDPSLPDWFLAPIGILRSSLERLAYQETAPSQWRIHPRFRFIGRRAQRFRYYGDLFWMRQSGIPSLLVTGSLWTADYLKKRGFDPFVNFLGSPKAWGTDLGLERDIPVLWLGKPGSRQRKATLDRIRGDLARRGVDLLMIDGIENAYVFGEERTRVLNRTQIVLNLLRKGWDDNSMRYYLAAPNRALILTETTLPHSLFNPGVHLVEGRKEELVDQILYYLSHPEERERIVEQAYHLVTENLSFENCVARLLDQIHKIRDEKSSSPEAQIPEFVTEAHT